MKKLIGKILLGSLLIVGLLSVLYFGKVLKVPVVSSKGIINAGEEIRYDNIKEYKMPLLDYYIDKKQYILWQDRIKVINKISGYTKRNGEPLKYKGVYMPMGDLSKFERGNK